MLAFLTLLYLGLIYIRPAEIFVAWQQVPAVMISAVLVAIGLAMSLLMRPRGLIASAQDWFLVLFAMAIAMSCVANGWVGGVAVSMGEFLPALFLYVLIACSFQSYGSIRTATFVWLCLNVVLAISGIVQHQTGTGLGGVTMIEGRIRGSGIFNDPNDLGLSFVMVLPFAVADVIDRGRPFWRRLLGAAIAGTLLWAVYLTNSRGSAVGTMAVVGLLMVQRFGKVTGIVPAVVMLAALVALAPSRLAAGGDSEDESSESRIEAWYAGLTMFRSSPVFGVGWDSFTDHHQLVAHNSYVHSFGELGAVGIFAFLGFLYLSLNQVRKRDGTMDESLRRQLYASVIGTLICIFFLSRQYVAYLYVPFAFAAAYGRLMGVTTGMKDYALILASVPGIVVVVYIAIRLMGG